MKKSILTFAAVLTLCSAAGCGSIAEETTGSTQMTDTASNEVTAAASTVTTAAAVTSEKETTASAAETAGASSASSSSEEPEPAREYSNEELEIMAQGYYGTRNNRLPEFTEIVPQDDGAVMIHMYDLYDGHTATYDWYTVDRKTGKGTNLIGNEIDLDSPPAEMWDPEVEERAQMRENGAFCGVAYIGTVLPQYMDDLQTNEEMNEMIRNSGIIDRFGFVAELPECNFAETELGTELYLIIPRDPEAHVVITRYDLENDRDVGRIYSSYNGSPLMLKCNYSDITSDIRISITDNEGEHEAFYPYISMKDGSPSATSDGVMVIDFDRPQ